MEIFNRYGLTLLVLGFVDGKPGQGKMVMPDNPEEVSGPPFMRDEKGQVVSHYSIPGKLTVVAAGRHDPENGVLVMPAEWQIVHEWTGHDFWRYKIVVQDYRILQKQRSSR